ncbi:MAG: 5-(carboxyamino)imidazole ribonucleotide mutase [Oscillospiraceae bacterium]|nr:5-(carboxyamino)imidazole ribonucleotide mutase [Oscillospiraceae bacterium]
MYMSKNAKVLIIMGSDSDFPIVERAINVLKGFSVEVEARVCSAHRTPRMASDLASNAQESGVDVIIAAAGKAAHLPGVIAAYTPLPVIGLPIQSSSVGGLDALLSIVQMPTGIPVATVALNGAENAALLAVQMISLRDENLRNEMIAYKEEMARKVEEKDNALQKKLAGDVM